MKQFKQITIIGVGLLGGSIGMAVKKKRVAGMVVGFFRDKTKIKAAIRMGAIDKGSNNLREAVKGSDLIILCSPVDDIISKLKDLKIIGLDDTLVTDTGSTKSEIMKAARGLNFVGSHPLAGSEQSGAAFAKSQLFEGSVCIITSKEKRSRSAERIAKFWKTLGSETIAMAPEDHDHILSFTSHLPHAAAFALIKCVPKNLFKFSAGGLKDTTRIALSNPLVWLDIFLSNRTNMLNSIISLERSLSQFKDALRRADRRKLLSFLKAAQANRKSLMLKP